MDTNKCLQAALRYAEQYGWAVFPVSHKTKKPLTPHGCRDAKKTPGAIKAWWKRWPDASIGIATGSASNLIVIDEDIDEDKGLDGYHEVSDWERLNSPLPDTVRAITGRGGSHLYFHYTGDDIHNRAGILDGVDVRGEGGYVVAPPSIHPNGTEYQWEVAPEDQPPAEVDEVVRRFLRIGSTKAEQKDFKLPQNIQSGERNDTLFRLACSLQSQGMPDGAILAALKETNRTACAEPLSDAELEIIASSALKYNKGELRVISTGVAEWHEPKLSMQLDKDGNPTDHPAQTIANCEEAIAFDKDLYGRIRYNELAYAPYVYGNLPWKMHKGWREWTNVDDSNLRSYIEKVYGLKSGEKCMDALANVAARFPVNPIRQMLETAHENWDGNKHVENLLPRMLGADKTAYNTQAMRLFMLGAVSRIYNPGCKFDYMLILVGEQGHNKSTFLRFLCLDDAYFNDNFSIMDGDKAFEKLRGMWIVELSELTAMKRAKDAETIKAFVTSRVDTYRAPYGRRTEQRPRMCVLAGTSNPKDFLTDKTGNRRFLPVTIDKKKATMNIYADEIATKWEISQAWGEIMDEFERCGRKPKLILPENLQEQAIKKQTEYLEEDTRIGVIQDWLDTHDTVNRVCALMVWKEALDGVGAPKQQEINAIHEIMKNQISGWKYVNRQRIQGYGIQRCYERKEVILDTSGEMVPFD